MKRSTKSLHSHIAKIFADEGADDFLLPIKLNDVYRFISREIIAGHSDAAEDEITLIIDVNTAADTTVLKKLRHAAKVYICGEKPQKKLKTPTNAVYIENSPIGDHDICVIILSSTSSYLVTQAPFSHKESELGSRPGYWSFHRESINSVARFVVASADIELPEYRPNALDYSVSRKTMNILAQLGHFIESEQQNAIVLKNDFSLILEILKSLSVRRSTHEILYLFVEQIATTVDTDRCSVVRIWEGELEGYVLASHEDSSVNNMTIDLTKYPEILNTLSTSEKTLVNDIPNDPVVAEVSDQLIEMGVTAILVVPIVLHDPKVGTFLLRTFRKGSTFTRREVEFCDIVAKTAANAIERADLFETIQKSNRSLERLATTDALTGLYNRRFFINHMEEEITRAVRYKIPIACILIDIDNFKSINDTYGHLEGDEVLRDVSKRTLESVRATDIVARYGGEELVILLPQTRLEGAKKHANRMLQTISEKSYRGLPDDVVITISIGISFHESNDAITADEFIKKADLALYEAKRTGKNKFVIYSD